MAKITKTNANKYTILLKSGLIKTSTGAENKSTDLFAGGGRIDLFISANPTTAGATTFEITGIYGQYSGNAISSLLTMGSTSPLAVLKTNGSPYFLTVTVNNYIDINSPLSQFLPIALNGSYGDTCSAIGFTTADGTNYYLYNLKFVDADPVKGEPLMTAANLEVLQKNGPLFTHWYDNDKTITNIQGLVTPYYQGTPLADTITGTFEAEWILGDAGSDVINGAGGNDTIDGGLGKDSMMGGLGDDTYYVDAATDKVTEKSNQGIDTVISSSNYTLGANVENLTLTGTSGLSGKGNTAANKMIGSSGNDTINGALGNDTLTGGLGNDTFVFNTKLGPTNIDTITDFTSGDRIALAGSIFSKLKGDKDLSDNLYVQTIVGIPTRDDKPENDYLFYDLESGGLYYDFDGYGYGYGYGYGSGKDAVQIAIIGTGGISLTANDFIIV